MAVPAVAAAVVAVVVVVVVVDDYLSMVTVACNSSRWRTTQVGGVQLKWVAYNSPDGRWAHDFASVPTLAAQLHAVEFLLATQAHLIRTCLRLEHGEDAIRSPVVDLLRDAVVPKCKSVRTERKASC